MGPRNSIPTPRRLTLSGTNFAFAALSVLIILSGCAQPGGQLADVECETLARKFFAAKEVQARQLAKIEAETASEGEPKRMAPDVWPFFEAGKHGDWKTASQLYER